jgi:hypothetical protein
MGSLASLCQVIIIHLVMYQVMPCHYQIRILVLQMLCAYQQFSNNFLQVRNSLLTLNKNGLCFNSMLGTTQFQESDIVIKLFLL